MVTLVLALAACVSGSYATQPTATSVGGSSVTVAPGVAVLNIANNSKLGKILVDGAGLTLYTFKLDTPGVSNCTSTCGATWPPLLSKTTPVLGSPDIKGTLGSTARPDGSLQVTYNGLPLYYFTLDTKPGDTGGNGYGGNWSVATP